MNERMEVERRRAAADDVEREIAGKAPRAADGRHVGPELGILRGEGSLQQVKDLDAEEPFPGAPALPSSTQQSDDTYYGLPALKETVWKGAIPAYFYVGGLAGASSALAAAAQLLGDGRLRGLVRRAQLIGAAGAVVSGALLIEDLGRPARFLHMLRVFRPTSPMNVGTWILSAFGAAASVAALPHLLGRRTPRALRALEPLAGAAAGLFGLPLVGYTGVLLANTAVPVWQGARTSLPPLFVASAAGSAAAALEPFVSTPREEKVLHRFAVWGKAGELLGMIAVEMEAGRTSGVADALRRGKAGALWRSAQLCMAASLWLSISPARERPRSWRPGGSRRRRIFAGLLGTAAALCTRFAIFEAGRVSARDPRATFRQQREGRGGSPS